MKRIVWTFGLIAGAIMAAMMFITMPFAEQLGGKAEIVGYSTMILAFVMVYVGIRTYRDTTLSGVIGFGRAFKVGLLIVLVASSCYVAAWEVIYHTTAKDFAEKYAASTVERLRSSGASEAEIAVQQEKMAKFVVAYKNPVFNVGMTFLEVFPVGLVVVLVSAGVLSRKKAAPGLEVARA